MEIPAQFTRRRSVRLPRVGSGSEVVKGVGGAGGHARRAPWIVLGVPQRLTMFVVLCAEMIGRNLHSLSLD